MIRVCIVDDQRLMREGLQTLIGLESDIEVVAIAGNGQEAVQAAETLSIDVMLLDIRMPVKNGIDAIKEIHETSPETRILMLTTYDTQDDVVGALSAGAVGYLLKDMPAEEIADAIRTANEGGAVLPPEIASTFLSAVQMQTAARAEGSTSTRTQLVTAGESKLPSDAMGRRPLAGASPTPSGRGGAGLTERETDVLHCLARGLSNKEIGGQLHVTEGTVKNHVSSLIAKLELRDRTQAALYAVRNGYGNLSEYP